MDICYLQLEKYCSLKAKGNSCNDDELYQMKRLKISLGCEEELSADYHLKIKDSFQQYVKNLLIFRKAQVDLMTYGITLIGWKISKNTLAVYQLTRATSFVILKKQVSNHQKMKQHLKSDGKSLKHSILKWYICIIFL